MVSFFFFDHMGDPWDIDELWAWGCSNHTAIRPNHGPCAPRINAQVQLNAPWLHPPISMDAMHQRIACHSTHFQSSAEETEKSHIQPSAASQRWDNTRACMQQHTSSHHGPKGVGRCEHLKACCGLDSGVIIQESWQEFNTSPLSWEIFSSHTNLYVSASFFSPPSPSSFYIPLLFSLGNKLKA